MGPFIALGVNIMRKEDATSQTSGPSPLVLIFAAKYIGRIAGGLEYVKWGLVANAASTVLFLLASLQVLKWKPSVLLNLSYVLNITSGLLYGSGLITALISAYRTANVLKKYGMLVKIVSALLAIAIGTTVAAVLIDVDWSTFKLLVLLLKAMEAAFDAALLLLVPLPSTASKRAKLLAAAAVLIAANIMLGVTIYMHESFTDYLADRLAMALTAVLYIIIATAYAHIARYLGVFSAYLLHVAYEKSMRSRKASSVRNIGEPRYYT